jgi:hypothetical protein
MTRSTRRRVHEIGTSRAGFEDGTPFAPEDATEELLDNGGQCPVACKTVAGFQQQVAIGLIAEYFDGSCLKQPTGVRCDQRCLSIR